MFESVAISREKSAQVLEKNKKSIDQDVEIIIEWIKTQPHLPEIMEETKIRNFLLLNKFSIEKTKQKIDMYYTIRSLIPDIFENSNPQCHIMQQFMNITFCCLHPKLIDDLYRVFFLKIKEKNSCWPKELGLQCNNIEEVRLYEDCMFSDIIVFDMITFSVSDLTKITPTLLTKLISIYANVFSIRIHKVYILNSPSYVSNLLKIIKSVVKPKIFNRIHVCQDTSILKDVFSEDDLPQDYGGNGPSLDELNELIIAKLLQYKNRFDLLDKLRVDESKRPQKLNNHEVLGFYGNFKQLSVD